MSPQHDHDQEDDTHGPGFGAHCTYSLNGRPCGRAIRPSPLPTPSPPPPIAGAVDDESDTSVCIQCRTWCKGVVLLACGTSRSRSSIRLV